MNQQDPSRVAVITGSGAGIGASVAQRFAADGDTVVLVTVSSRSRVGREPA